MKNLYTAFETNPQLETEGVCLDFGGPKFYVRRAGGANRRYSAVFQEKVKPHKRAMAAGTLDPATSEKVLVDVYFETVIIGWENVTDRQDKPMEFNKANFVKLVTDLPELWEMLRSEAADIKNFQAAVAVMDGEQLGNESAGT